MMQLWSVFETWISTFPRITLSNIFEIVIIAYLVYEILLWIKNTRAWVLLRGLLLIFLFTLFAAILRLDTILWLLGRIATIAVTALIIIFQPELRRALEQLGSKNIFAGLFPSGSDNTSEYTEKTINEIAKASFEMGKVRTGALIVIEQKESLSDIERTGIEIDAAISSQLLINIFEHNTPLHDGAVVVRANRVVAATCYLPLSENKYISKDLGTRHRAAIGISENTDSITVVVSEETGRVSVAREGMLRSMDDVDELKKSLSIILKQKEPTHRFKLWKGRV